MIMDDYERWLRDMNLGILNTDDGSLRSLISNGSAISHLIPDQLFATTFFGQNEAKLALSALWKDIRNGASTTTNREALSKLIGDWMSPHSGSPAFNFVPASFPSGTSSPVPLSESSYGSTGVGPLGIIAGGRPDYSESESSLPENRQKSANPTRQAPPVIREWRALTPADFDQSGVPDLHGSSTNIGLSGVAEQHPEYLEDETNLPENPQGNADSTKQAPPMGIGIWRPFTLVDLQVEASRVSDSKHTSTNVGLSEAAEPHPGHSERAANRPRKRQKSANMMPPPSMDRRLPESLERISELQLQATDATLSKMSLKGKGREASAAVNEEHGNPETRALTEDFEKEFADMKRDVINLEAENRRLAKIFHSLAELSQQQAELLRQSYGHDFSEVLHRLKEDDVKAQKLQGILKVALQSIVDITTFLSNAGQPSGEELFETFMQYPKSDVGTSVGYGMGSNQGGL